MKLDRTQQRDREEIIGRIEAAGNAMQDAVSAYETAQAAALEAFNATMRAAHEELTKASKAHLDDMTDAHDRFEQIGGDLRGLWEEKSEKWQDGDKGLQASAWIEKFEDVELPEYVVDAYEPLTKEALTAIEPFDGEADLPGENDDE